MTDSPSLKRESARIFLLFYIFIFGLMSPAWAHQSDLAYSQTIYGRLQFSKVELIGRQHEIGLYRGRSISLSPWIAVGDHAYLGVSEDHKLFQVVELKDRKVAFLLSGEKEIKDVFLLGDQTLLALDREGELYRFSWAKWSYSGFSALVRETATWSAVGVGAAGVATGLTAALAQVPLPMEILTLEWGLLSASVIGNLAYFASVRFEHNNEITDGLIPLGRKIENYKTSEMIQDGDGRILDYRLVSRGGEVSLNAQIEHLAPFAYTAKGFEKTCEHDLLARGIPPEDYEPQR